MIVFLTEYLVVVSERKMSHSNSISTPKTQSVFKQAGLKTFEMSKFGRREKIVFVW